MKPELRARILSYNKTLASRAEKATDMDILVKAVLTLPSGQLKKVLSEDVLSVLSKYGYTGEV